MAAIQAVHVRGHEERSDPKPHVVYRIEVEASVRSWQMWRRYSEFVDLNTELTKTTGSEPPCLLPPKHAFIIRRFQNEAKIVEERMVGLEAYLRAIISSREDKWRDAQAFREFLGIPVGKAGFDGGPPSAFTSASWLDEHMDLQSRIRDIRADVNKRDALSDRGDITGAHSTNVQAKKKLATALNRLGTLAKGLQTLAMGGLSEGEIQRRSDMLARLQDDCEKLSKMMIAARAPARGMTSTIAGNQPAASESDRADLLGPPPPKPFARVFGSVAKPQETDQTRPLDEQGLLQLQQTQVDQQDSQLAVLSSILQRQKHLGVAIGEEIGQQIDLLKDLDADVDRVGGKLSSAKKQLNRLG